MAATPPVSARSALTVLLDEVKAFSARGDAESVAELLETVMLRLKKNDDTLHRQALESWQEQQARKARPSEESGGGGGEAGAGGGVAFGSAAAVVTGKEQQGGAGAGEALADGYSVKSFLQGAIDMGLSKSSVEQPRDAGDEGDGRGAGHEAATGPPATPPPRERGLETVRVRGTGCYAQGKLEGGDARAVWVGGKLLVGGDNKTSSAKKAAGLWLLVLRLATFETLFSCLYDTHHDSGAADRFAADMATHALERGDAAPERVLVIVTSQYSWEGCFSSAVLCERLARF